MRSHFWPFVDVQNGNRREVMREVGVAAERPPITRLPPRNRRTTTDGKRYGGQAADITDKDEPRKQKKNQGPLMENQLRGKWEFPNRRKRRQRRSLQSGRIGTYLCFLRYLLLKKKRFGALPISTALKASLVAPHRSVLSAFHG